MTDASADWPFADPINCAVIVSRRIITANEPVLSVSHSDPDGWCFWDGTDFSEEEAMVVGLGTMTKYDPSLLALCNLPFGWRAWRPDAADRWQFLQSTGQVT